MGFASWQSGFVNWQTSLVKWQCLDCCRGPRSPFMHRCSRVSWAPPPKARSAVQCKHPKSQTYMSIDAPQFGQLTEAKLSIDKFNFVHWQPQVCPSTGLFLSTDKLWFIDWDAWIRHPGWVGPIQHPGPWILLFSICSNYLEEFAVYQRTTVPIKPLSLIWSQHTHTLQPISIWLLRNGVPEIRYQSQWCEAPVHTPVQHCCLVCWLPSLAYSMGSAMISLIEEW